MQAVEESQEELDALSSGCTAINTALAANRSFSADFFSESERLQHELATNKQRCVLVQKFFEQYQLSPAELLALQVRQLKAGLTFLQRLLSSLCIILWCPCRMQTLKQNSLRH